MRSGGLGTGLSVENQRDKQAQFDALQQALARIGQAQGGYNDVVQQGASDVAAAGDTAVQRQIGLHPASGGGSIPAYYDENTGLYQAADGSFFNHDGTSTYPGAANAAPVHPANVAPPPPAPAPTASPVAPVPKVSVAPWTSTVQPGDATPYGVQGDFGVGRTAAPPAVPVASKFTPTTQPGDATPYGVQGDFGLGRSSRTPGLPAPNPVPVPAPSPGVAQNTTFGGSSGPYVGTMKRLNVGF